MHTQQIWQILILSERVTDPYTHAKKNTIRLTDLYLS